MNIVQAIKIARESVKAANELQRKRDAILALEATPLNYGILQDLLNEVARRGQSVEVQVKLQDGSVIQVKAPDRFDAHKAQEELDREFWRQG